MTADNPTTIGLVSRAVCMGVILPGRETRGPGPPARADGPEGRGYSLILTAFTPEVRVALAET